eukprot:432114-Prymnesium_polylepis.1
MRVIDRTRHPRVCRCRVSVIPYRTERCTVIGVGEMRTGSEHPPSGETMVRDAHTSWAVECGLLRDSALV